MFDDHVGTVAVKNLEAEHFLNSLRLSDHAATHFGLQAVPAPTGTVSRLHIPIHDHSGKVVGSCRRSLYDHAFCSSCKERVSAADVANQKRRFDDALEDGRDLPFDDWRDCPYCGASKKKARISWLLGQFPKYLVSPHLDKSSLLYNSHEAKRLRRIPHTTRGTLLLCEGFTDVWALYDAGYEYAVACMGARCSERQLDLIEEMLDERPEASRMVAVAYDSDKTGLVNGKRDVRALRKRGIPAFAIYNYGEGINDPSEYLQRYGAQLLARQIDQEILEGIPEALSEME